MAGRYLVGGSAYRCAIAPGWSPQPASPQPDDAQVFEPQRAASLDMPLVHCTTPPADAATELVAPQLSLNRLDYSNNTRVLFRYYDPPRLLAFSPSSGPAHGDTRVVLSGANFSALGSQLVCRWGGTHPDSLPWVLLEELVAPPQRTLPFAHSPAAQSALPDGLRGPNGVAARPAYGLAATEVFATIVGPREAVCLAPARLVLRATALPLELSLNGHDFTADGLLYQYYAPSPRLHTTWPLTDTSAGGRPVTVRGEHLGNGSHYQCLYERSGEVALVTVDGGHRAVAYPYDAYPPTLYDAEAAQPFEP